MHLLFGDFAARIYCTPHHKHVNRTIENHATRELIKSLFRGSAETLDRSDQTRLAIWATRPATPSGGWCAEGGAFRSRTGGVSSRPLNRIRPYSSPSRAPQQTAYGSSSRATRSPAALTASVSHYYDFVLVLGPL